LRRRAVTSRAAKVPLGGTYGARLARRAPSLTRAEHPRRVELAARVLPA
jgi:hypothetical protein